MSELEPFKVQVFSCDYQRARANGKVYAQCMTLIMESISKMETKIEVDVTCADIEDLRHTVSELQQKLESEKALRKAWIQKCHDYGNRVEELQRENERLQNIIDELLSEEEIISTEDAVNFVIF